MRAPILPLSCLVALVLVAGSSGCEEDSPRAPPGLQVGFDAGPTDGSPSPTQDAPFENAGVGRITVVASRGLAPIAGVSVVAHDAAGMPSAPQITDAAGNAVLSIPEGGMVTVFTGNATTHRLVTYTGVMPGDVLAVRDYQTWDVSLEIGAGGFPAMPQGSENFNNVVGIPCEVNVRSTPPATTLVPTTTDCVVGPAVAAVAFINLGTSLYATWKRDQSLVTGGTTTVTGMPAFSLLGAQKVATTFVGRAPGSSVAFGHIANGSLFTNTAFESGPIESEDFVVMPGFADAYQYAYVSNDQSLIPLLRDVRTVRRVPATTTTLTLDVSSTLPSITSLAISRGPRPAFQWTSAEPLTATDGGSASIEWTDGTVKSIWNIIVPPSAGAVTAPTLPASLASWAPSAAATFTAGGLVFIDSDRVGTYGDLRAGAGALQMAPLYRTTPVLPVDGVVRMTSASRVDF